MTELVLTAADALAHARGPRRRHAARTVARRLPGDGLDAAGHAVREPRRVRPGDDLLVYVEVAEVDAYTAARMLHHLRLAGWFDRATGILVGRTSAPDSSDYTQLDALRDALGPLDVPVLYDLDIGHVPPQLALVNGALAEVTLDSSGTGTLVQQLM